MIINTNTNSYLTTAISPQRVITMNPPWTGGLPFIDKAVSDLLPNGVLILVMGYNQFTPKPLKRGPKPGSFLDLQSRGTFEHIECFKGSSDRDWFGNHQNARGDWCWCVFRKKG